MALTEAQRAELLAAGQRDVAKLREVPEKLAKVLATLRGVLEQAVTGELLVDAGTRDATHRAREAQAAKMKAARQTARETVDAYESLAQSAKARAQAGLEAAATDKPSDTSEALLIEMQQQAAWRRIEQRIAQASEPDAVIKRIAEDAAARGDTATFRALRAELPGALRVEGNDADTRRNAAEYLAATLAIVTAAESPALSPQQREARILAEEIPDGWYRLQLDFSLARNEIIERSMADLLVAWDGSTFPIG